MKKIKTVILICVLIIFCAGVVSAQSMTTQVEKNRMLTNNERVNYVVKPAVNQVSLTNPAVLSTSANGNSRSPKVAPAENINGNVSKKLVRSKSAAKTTRPKSISSNQPLNSNE